MNNDLELAYKTLRGKSPLIQTAWDYYNGDQRLKYSTERLREAFRDIDARFIQNWCSVVVDSLLERLNLKGVEVKNDVPANELISQLWSTAAINLDADEVNRCLGVTGEAYIIAWREEEELDIYVNDPAMCHVFYDEERPKVKRFAAKLWNSGGEWMITLYYPERFEYYSCISKELPASARAFKPREIANEVNPTGVIPVFHFRGRSELKNIITMQDAVNKLFADMMVASEFGSFPQRWVISNSDITALRNSPNEVWSIPSGDGSSQGAQVGQFQSASLDGYLAAIDKVCNAIAVVSRTPKHYFMFSGSQVSGDALIAMEAPLVKKVEHIQEMVNPVWQEFIAFLLQLYGIFIDPSDIMLTWEPPASIQPYLQAQTVQALTGAQVPLKTALRWAGKNKDEMDQLDGDIKEQKLSQAVYGAQMLEELRKRSEQSNPPELE